MMRKRMRLQTEALEIEVYNFDAEAGEYYVDSSWLNAGDILARRKGRKPIR